MVNVLRTFTIYHAAKHLGWDLMLSLFTSVATTLEKQPEPVITDYDLTLLISRLYREANNGQTCPNKSVFNSILTSLIDFNIIKRNKDFTGGTVFSIVKNNSNDIYSILCSVDPFLYVSHLSAMNLYGMSDIATNNIYITEPSSSMWLDLANEKIIKDTALFGNTSKLHKTYFDKIGNYKIIKYTEKYYGEFAVLKNSNVRIANLGRTFLDMIRKPNYAGTMQHVVHTYTEFGPQYSESIIDQIDKYGSPIEKVRAGFILEEYCKVKNPIIDTWLKYCQRGGSRKLDSSKEYKSKFSERWCLSINL